MGLLTVLTRAVDPTRTPSGHRSRGARGTPLLVCAALVAGLAACGDSGTGPPAAPGAPGGLTVTVLSVSTVRLDWSDPEGTERIEIERAVEGGDFANRANVGSGTERFQDSGLDPDTRYRYRIRACNEGGCSSFTSSSQATTLAELAVVTTGLPLAVQGRAYDQQLEASGGDGEYTWSADAATLPAGLSLAASGALTGTPSATGSFEIDVEVESGDGQGTDGTVTLDVNPELQITTSSLPDGTRDEAYQATLSATGGDGTFTWSADGATLPDGLSLSETGELSGTPTEGGDFALEVEVESGDGQTAAATLDLHVAAPVEVATSSLPDATVDEAYEESLEATGGDGDYTWSLAASSLPSGLTLDAGGTISGTPDTEQTATFTVRVESGAGDADQRELSITVQDAAEPVSITTGFLVPTVAGGSYRATLRAEGGDGENYTWSVVGGSLPAGVTLDGDGTFGGSPSADGTATFTVRAQSGGETAEATFDLVVVPLDETRFNITPFNVVAVDPAIQEHVDAAVARWEEVINGDLAHVQIAGDFFTDAHCGGFGLDVNGASFDDLLVLVNIAPDDGPGGTLGFAGPCGLRRNDAIPFAGALTLDSEDVELRVGTQALTDILFHEIGHILGIGVIWDRLGLLEGAGTDDPRFTGADAVDEWQDLGGSDDVPVHNLGGPGSRDSHWRESVFRSEIMTPNINIGANPLSRMTVGSLADMGYEVDLGAADSYSLPDASLQDSSGPGIIGWDHVPLDPILMILPDGSARELRPLQ